MYLAPTLFRRAHAEKRDRVGTAEQSPRSNPIFGAAFAHPTQRAKGV
jgi:hypothetical protein